MSVPQLVLCDVLLCTVLSAIDFDDQPAFEANKVNDETINRRLSAKVMAVRNS